MGVKAVGVGFSCIDVYEKLDKAYPTGNGVDWGIHLARLGMEVAVVSVVGTDAYGDLMKKALSGEGIDISRLHTAEGDTCRMMMELKNGVDRVHLNEIEGVMADFALTQDDLAFIKKHDFIHTDLFGKALEHLPEMRSSGAKIVMDFSIFAEDPAYNCRAIYPNVDYVFLSHDGPEEHAVRLIKEIAALGPRIAVATRGEKGSIAWDGSTLHRCGIVPCMEVNTVGAGDSYIAGFTYGLAQGWEIPSCMQKGAEVSSGVVAKFEPY